MNTIHLTGAGKGEHWLVGGETTTIKVSERDEAGDLLVVETAVPPGGGPPSLVRHEFTEVFYVLEGEFEFGMMGADGKPGIVSARAGDTVFVPSMAWHGYKNVGEARGRLLTTPNTTAIENIAHKIGQRIEDPENPPAPEGPPSEEEMRRARELLSKYKVEVMPPDNV